MWGFFNAKNRELSNKIFNLILNKQLALKYNLNSKKLMAQKVIRYVG